MALGPNQSLGGGIQPLPSRQPQPSHRRPRPRRRGRRRGLSPAQRRARNRFDPTRPPGGTYDPGLDAQQRASQRGLQDLTQDVGTQNLRSRQDLQLGLQDLMRSRRNESADFSRSVEGLNRQYGQLASRQQQSANAAGVSEGGALTQALRKRTANQAWDRAPIDTAHQRFQQQADLRQGQLALNFQRNWQDRNTVQLPRARREATEFGQDVAAQRFYEAKSTGWVPPANQYRKYGLTYRMTGRDLRHRVYTLPSGQQFNRRQWVGYINSRRRRRPAAPRPVPVPGRLPN